MSPSRIIYPTKMSTKRDEKLNYVGRIDYAAWIEWKGRPDVIID